MRSLTARGQAGDVAGAVQEPAAREARALGRGRAARTPFMLVAVVATAIAVVAGLIIGLVFLIGSFS